MNKVQTGHTALVVLLKGYRSVQVNKKYCVNEEIFDCQLGKEVQVGSSCMGNIPLPFTNLFEIDSSGLAMKRLGSNFAVIDKVFPF